MKTNVLLAGFVLFGVCYLAGVPIVGVIVLGVAIALFVLRNGMLRR